MKPINLFELRSANIARDEQIFQHVGEWSETDWATAVAGECGEMCNLIKKRRRGDQIDTKKVADEMADILIYLDLLAYRMGIDLSEALRDKFNEKSKELGSTIML